MLEQALRDLFAIFFSESTMSTHPVIFDTIIIVFLILFLIFIFFGLTSLCRHKV